ncbi:pentapeptide repeat-containing protein [Methylomonas sp. EFPC3]|uniref:pentapeptide repeat-containing protein n=1 Tax=Methylomonas sp. EFPC3 TaxID=3021710 RepID=UPI00241631C1|nr:pentapeptide repeat-containing protein [Methylomonas sp. EFPC3]WFP51367.1 pentapeptide repeat-containing protein [Methylomonas sp. EFPC3]
MNWRGFKHEEALLLPLRRLILAWQSWGGSDFRGANLNNADFRQANLRQARFNDTALIGCRWQQAKNLHLADFRRTLLESKAARLLLGQGDIGDCNFAHANLRGAVLAGLDLTGVNFHHTDLSQADLRACLLRDADLSEAMALTTDFSEAEFTGAILEKLERRQNHPLRRRSSPFCLSKT